MSEEEADKRLAGLLTAFDLAFQRTMNAITTDRDLDRAFRRATVIGDHVQKIREELTGLRAVTAKSIYDRDSLSLAGLADRISVSRTRAAQLVNEAKQQQDDSQRKEQR
jgi:hypothetical protein